MFWGYLPNADDALSMMSSCMTDDDDDYSLLWWWSWFRVFFVAGSVIHVLVVLSASAEAYPWFSIDEKAWEILLWHPRNVFGMMSSSFWICRISDHQSPTYAFELSFLITTFVSLLKVQWNNKAIPSIHIIFITTTLSHSSLTTDGSIQICQMLNSSIIHYCEFIRLDGHWKLIVSHKCHD